VVDGARVPRVLPAEDVGRLPYALAGNIQLRAVDGGPDARPHHGPRHARHEGACHAGHRRGEQLHPGILVVVRAVASQCGACG
jgi:hypothetical protein